MKVKRHTERFGPFENGREERVVEKAAVNGSVDHSAREVKAVYCAFELSRCGGRVPHRQSSESGEAAGIALHGFCHFVIDALRGWNRAARLEKFGRRIGVGKHLNIDAGRVHVGDTLLAEIPQL